MEITSICGGHPSPRQAKRNKTNVACLQCHCVFEQDDRKVVVSEKFKSASLQPTHPVISAHRFITDVSAAPSNPELTTDDGLPQMINPLVAPPSKFVVDYQGRKRFLGPSSTWAYSRHVMGMIRQYVDQEASPEVPLNHDGAAFNLELPSMKQSDVVISMESLPSLDYALYLTNTVKFHIVQTYHLFDEEHFMQNLMSLYSDGPPPLSAENRMRYVQYFLVMALGKGLLTRGMSKAGLPGGDYFMRAMELFPNANDLYQDPILSIEVCCGLALYLQAVDHRNSAYLYLGMALRIALSQGLHRDIVSGVLDDLEVTRYRNAWWTLYILDRKLSSLMGAPCSIHDSDISVPIPKDQTASRKSSALDMHIKLSRLKAKVLDSSSHTLKNALRCITGFSNAKPLLPPVLQCIVLATRPLLMCLLRDKLEMGRTGNDSHCEIVEPIKALLRTCYDSANKSLRILTKLQSQDLLELFLPFDLDHAFSAGFILALISAIQPFPDVVGGSYFETITHLLDALIAGGNLPACFRRQELERLHDMLHLIDQRDNAPQFEGQENNNIPVLEEHGISPNQLLNVASMLDGHAYLNVDLGDVSSWLWETTGFEGLPPL
ncbi:hypothetical protein HG530_014778 [Fusarium avenaceum]|nr:hypothetical protein HG530_014778 [Fusarium avenaceum]